MPSCEGREENDVEERDAGGVERVGGPCITTRALHLTQHEAHDAGNDPDRELDLRRQPAVLHGVADEESAGEEERERSDNREELHANERFPIERSPGTRWL